MNNIYQYILKNRTLDTLTKSLIEGNSIIIVKENSEVDSLIEYFNEFIINNLDKGKLLTLIEQIDKNNLIDKIKIKKMTVLRREIINNKDNIINIFNAFNNKGEMGYSLNDLYSVTNKCIEFKDKEFEYYSVLSKSHVIKNNERDIIIERVKRLIKSKKVNVYIKYRKFKDSKRFDIIKEEIDKGDLDKVINKLSGVLNNIFAFIPPIYFNEYTSDFERESIYYKNYSNDQIMEVAKEVNKRHNEDILNNIVKLKWYNISHIINYKKIIEKNRLINEEYKNLQVKIYNEYLENIDNLKMFVNSFSFIKKVYKDEVLESINKCIVSDDELYNYIKYIKETLVIYKEYLLVKEEIELLDSIEMEILSYHYEKLKNKQELVNLLIFIPNYYLYKEIENIEEDNSDIINSYNKLYDRFRRLNNALFSYDEILLEVLRGFCNKNLYEFINDNEMKLEELNASDLVAEKYSVDNLRILLKLYPIVIIDKKDYFKDKEKIDSYFDVIIRSSEFLFDDANNNVDECRVINERLDKNITHLLSNLGYSIFEKEKNFSVIYINKCKCEEEKKLVYINSKEYFVCDDLINLLVLLNEGNDIIFVWYRNWWLNKNEEVEKIQGLL